MYEIINTVLCVMIYADMLNLGHVIFYTGCSNHTQREKNLIMQAYHSVNSLN